MNPDKYNLIIPIDSAPVTLRLLDNVSEFSKRIPSRIICKVRNGTDSDFFNQIRSFLTERGILDFSIDVTGDFNDILPLPENIANNSLIFLPNYSDLKMKIGADEEFILMQANCPVLLLKYDLDISQISNLLIPVDLNHENKVKISMALFFAGFFIQPTIRLASVVENPDDFLLNKMAYRLSHLSHFFHKFNLTAVGEIIRFVPDETSHRLKAIVDYAGKSEAEIVIVTIMPDHHTLHFEEFDNDYFLLSNVKNNIISISPFVKIKTVHD